MTSNSSLPDCLLFTRPGCHLCDEAETVLRKHGLSPKKVDIDEQADLKDRYSNCVPVVFLDGKRRFTGRVDERLLLRLLPRKS